MRTVEEEADPMKTSATAASLHATGILAGEAAKVLGVGVQTLHYYERVGLIPPPARSDSGYRLFTPDIVERVAFIRKAQTLGLPLAEIRDIISLAEQGASPCGRVQRSLAAKLAEVDRRLAELQAFRRELAGLIDRSAVLGQQRGTAQLCAIVEGAPAITSEFVTLPLSRRTGKARVR
jgi:DNA-binding transcriptional MerR regulator